MKVKIDTSSSAVSTKKNKKTAIITETSEEAEQAESEQAESKQAIT